MFFLLPSILHSSLFIVLLPILFPFFQLFIWNNNIKSGKIKRFYEKN